MNHRTYIIATLLLGSLVNLWGNDRKNSLAGMPSEEISAPFMDVEKLGITFVDHVASDTPEKKPLLIREVLESIGKSYPTILADQKQILAKEQEKRASEGIFDPVLQAKYDARKFGDYNNQTMDLNVDQRLGPMGLSLFGGYKQGAGDFPIYDGKMDTNEHGLIYGGLKIPTLKGRATDLGRNSIKAQEIQLLGATAQWQSNLNQISWMSKSKYWDWVGSGLKLQVSQSMLKLAQARDNYLKVRFEKGDISKLVWVDNQRIILQRKNKVNQAIREKQKYAFDLSVYLRDTNGNMFLPTDQQLPAYVEPPVDPKEIETFKEWSIELHPDLVEIKRSIEENLNEQALLRNNTLPKLDLEVGSRRDLGEGPFKNKTELNVGGQFEMPLLFRQARGKLAAIKAKEEALRQKERLLKETLQNQAQDAILAMRIHKQTYLDAKQEADVSLQVEQGEKIKFSSGDSDLLLLNIREQASVDAIFREIDALVQYYQTKASFEAVVTKSPT